MANSQHIEWLHEGVETWNKRRERGRDFTPDLRNADLRSADLTNANLREADLRNADLRNKNLTNADLTLANLTSAGLMWADLTSAKLFQADLTSANLGSANLTNANLHLADLTNANLYKATLTNADLSGSDLTGTDLSYSEPWTANLYPTNNITGDDTTNETRENSRKKKIKSIECLLNECRGLRDKHSDEVLYFRGESSSSWELRPSVMRPENNTLRASEGEMLLDLMSRQPDEFSSLISGIGQWVLAQHHRLKTRLLDITRNPLVALFNACEKFDTQNGSDSEDGRLHVFATRRSLIKPFNSDTISIIANFSKLQQNEQNLILGKKLENEDPTADYAQGMGRLYHFIRHEKPYFLEKIDPRGFFCVFVVEPQRSFDRLRAQSGAFLISAFHERFERDEILKWNDGIPVYDHYMLTVSSESKQHIKDELRLLNITRESLFPGLDEAANAVTQLYSTERSANGGT